MQPAIYAAIKDGCWSGTARRPLAPTRSWRPVLVLPAFQQALARRLPLVLPLALVVPLPQAWRRLSSALPVLPQVLPPVLPQVLPQVLPLRALLVLPLLQAPLAPQP
jgi:hypothetical protein